MKDEMLQGKPGLFSVELVFRFDHDIVDCYRAYFECGCFISRVGLLCIVGVITSWSTISSSLMAQMPGCSDWFR